MAADLSADESTSRTAVVAAPLPVVAVGWGRSFIRHLRPTLLHIGRQQRDVVAAFSLALLMNGALWLMRRLWFPFNPSIAWSGSLMLAVNLGLSLVFARKGHVFVQALSVTAVVIELLLLILIVRTGTAGA